MKPPKRQICIPWRSIFATGLAALPIASMADPEQRVHVQPSVSAETVHVQPRRPDFMPNSPEDGATQRRLSIFNEQQGVEDVSLDKKLKICKGC